MVQYQFDSPNFSISSQTIMILTLGVNLIAIQNDFVVHNKKDVDGDIDEIFKPVVCEKFEFAS